MPFGPYKGQQLADLATRYLRWIVSDVSPTDWPELVEAAKLELQFRQEFSKETEVTL